MRYKYETSNTGNYPLLKDFAKENRIFPTEAEDILWRRLRNKKLGYRFRRQHPIDNFIADFVCLELNLIIEVDGGYHHTAEMQLSDEERTRMLNESGFSVIRFTNEEVINDERRVIMQIKETMDNIKGCQTEEKSQVAHAPSLGGGRGRFEIMAPVGSPESLAAALRAGADSIYFGISRLNMRAHSASTFTIDDLHDIARKCHTFGVKSYLTVNTIIYNDDLPLMRQILDAAKAAEISAIIASDVAVMTYCRQIGLEVHLSTQLNISNIEALRFYAQFADVVVLARELKMEQVAEIYQQIQEQHITGPSGQLVRIEMFCHGALCMAVSGKCYLSLDNMGRSANRGECMQLCRRSYIVRDTETGTELQVENKYIMSPRDLKTIRFIDRMMQAGVRVFKIEGRARGADYVDTVVRCYKEAIQAVQDGTFNDERCDEWDQRLSRVFNRGFWDGYYQGQLLGEWTKKPGSSATEKKTYCARGIRYYSKLGVAEFKIEACPLHVGDEVLIIGPTTGAIRLNVSEIRYELRPVQEARQGWHISIPVPAKVRPSDKLFIVTRND